MLIFVGGLTFVIGFLMGMHITLYVDRQYEALLEDQINRKDTKLKEIADVMRQSLVGEETCQVTAKGIKLH